MLPPDLTRVPPGARSWDEMTVRKPLDLSFEGFPEDAFAILQRLRAHPHIDQYREDKPGIQAHIKAPFKQYRNDLVVNWVLPSRLALETEKNVFSRLLKNDFGAGGCHDHRWMAFYRPDYRRLTDVQLSHSLGPDGLKIGLYAGSYGTEVLKQVQASIARQPERFRALVNELLRDEGWTFRFYRGSGAQRNYDAFDQPLAALPEGLSSADGMWLRTCIPAAVVVADGPYLIRRALRHIAALWPLYRFYLIDEQAPNA
ncbi:MAG: hypothetical protein GVY15_07970 [Bacteroidetes bacterium]|jgi:uncharacterized protein (DUF2461 family)|nr:hypothetical protein [Bacteroidota bacterium]